MSRQLLFQDDVQERPEIRRTPRRALQPMLVMDARNVGVAGQQFPRARFEPVRHRRQDSLCAFQNLLQDFRAEPLPF